MSIALGVKTDLVWAFDRQHKVGTICGLICEQCGSPIEMVGTNGETIPNTPLFIFAEATKEDWERSVRGAGGNPVLDHKRYFYFVHAD